MRKNNIKKNIKKVAKKAQRNPEVAVAVTATTAAFSVFGMIEAGIIVKNKAKAKITEIKAKKEAKKAQQSEQTEQAQQPVAEDEAKNNNEGAEA